MKLIELELKDFRQYYDKQVINFDFNDDKNISIILGENGEGKTGIFRAVIFSLFGQVFLNEEEHTSLREKKKLDALHLVNLNKMKENVGSPIKAYVKLKFQHEGCIYEITRSKLEMMDDGEIFEDDEVNVNMYIKHLDGNEDVITNDEEIQGILSNILDKKLKDFFLFDGEKIESLSKPKKETREEVKRGILKLLQIDSVTNSIEVLESLERKQNKRIKKYSQNTLLRAKTEELEKFEKNIESCEKDIDILDEDITNFSIEIEGIEEKLAENKDINLLIQKRDEKEKEKRDKKRLLDNIVNSARKILSNQGHNLILEDYILRTKNFIGQESVDRNYSVDISIELLENILNRKRCICGREFEEGTKPEQVLMEVKKQYSKSELSSFINIFRSRIREFYDNRKSYKEEIDNILYQASEVNEEIDKVNIEIDNINKKIKQKSKNEENLKELEEKLYNCKGMKNKLERRKIECVTNSKIFKEKVEFIGEEIENLTKGEEALKIESVKLKYIRELKSNFNNVLIEYSTEMREKISKKATDIFKRLISDKDKNIIEEIQINEHYEIKILGWNKNYITSDISAGQRQIVSLAFVIALAKVASASKNKMNVPLFMDTPFGRVSGENRDKLINQIPFITSQWILLMTDTEFTRAEEMEFKRTNKINNVYRLKQLKPGYTKIEKIENINEPIARR
ncbi:MULTISPECIES: AAA family ATPase [unclassified Clostridium]|uniref:AAA family ATPase n=1 Tax=unclassified Clostridium TaxID=2614128 RepID=UPI003F8E78C2